MKRADSSRDAVEVRKERLLREMFGGDRPEGRPTFIDAIAAVAMVVLAGLAVVGAWPPPVQAVATPSRQADIHPAGHGMPAPTAKN